MTLVGVLRRIGRTVLLYGWFVALSAVMYLLINAGFLDEFRIVVQDYVSLVINVVSTVFSLFALNTCTHQFAKNDEILYRARLTEQPVPVPRFRHECKTVLKSPQFRIETIVLAMLIFLLPNAVGWKALGALAEQYLPIKPIFRHFVNAFFLMLFTFLCNLNAHLSARKQWRTDACTNVMTQRPGKKKEPATPLRRLVRGCITVSFIYGCCAYLGLMTFFAIAMVTVTIARVITWQFLVFCLSVLICICLHRYWQAIHARKHFKRDVMKICREHGYTCSQFAHLYTSVFSAKQCGSFSVTVNDKVYTCRIVGAVRRKNRMYIDANGCMHEFVFKLFRQPIFNFYSHTAFAFPDGGNNILIVLPAPFQMIIQNGKTAREAQPGDIVGSFRMFTSQDYLGALSRNCLER